MTCLLTVDIDRMALSLGDLFRMLPNKNIELFSPYTAQCPNGAVTAPGRTPEREPGCLGQSVVSDDEGDFSGQVVFLVFLV